jgi:hypothetical protein
MFPRGQLALRFLRLGRFGSYGEWGYDGRTMAGSPYVKRYLRDFWRSLSLSLKGSLIIFLAVLLLGATSWVREFMGTTEDRLNSIFVYEGRVIWKHRDAAGADYSNAFGPYIGFVLLHTGAFKTMTTKGTLWTVEIWLPLVAFAFGLPPAIRFLRFREERLRDWRLRRGLCQNCGYDLRAGHERCPECGSTPPVQGSTSNAE